VARNQNGRDPSNKQVTDVILQISGFYGVFACPQIAGGDPVGLYDIVGVSPENGRAFEGIVAIEKNGPDYDVIWQINGEKYFGTAIAGANLKGPLMDSVIAGNSSLAISYGWGANSGLAMFVELDSGQWSSVWTYGESDILAAGTWTPR